MEELAVDVDASSGDLTITSERGAVRVRHLANGTPDVRLEAATVTTRDEHGALRSILMNRGFAVEELLMRRAGGPTGYELELPLGWTTHQPDGDDAIVEIRDDRRRARFRMVADFAWDVEGTRWPVATRVNGRQLTFSVPEAAVGEVLIDPAWSSTSTPAKVRSRASATVLPSGKVLVVGGGGDGSISGVLCTTEIYDPLGETWEMGPSLRAPEDDACTALMDHTATPLRDGTVLITGGASDDAFVGVAQQPAAVSTAWIYDPVANSFARTGAMVEARIHHTATLLASGKVLVAGGADRQSPLLEGFSDCASSPDGTETCERCIGKPSAEIFDPATGTFSLIPMPEARACHTATRLSDDSVLLIGGGGERTSVLGKAWGKARSDLTLFRMDASGPKFTRLDMTLNTARFGHVAVLDHDAANPDADQILVAFGRDERAILPGISPQPNAQLAEIIDVKGALAGTSPTATALDTPVCCDQSNPTCTNPDPCVTRRSYAAGTLLPRTAEALVVGGQEHDVTGNLNRDATPSDKVDVFDFASRTFIETSLGHSPVLKPALVTLPNGKTLLLGQTAPPALFDDETWAFAPPTTPMAQPRFWQTATQLSDGTLLVAGGLTPFATKGAEIYDPSATPPTAALLAARMTACRQGHTATLLPASACAADAECCSGTCAAGRCVGPDTGAACALGRSEHVLLTGGAGLGGGPKDGGLTDCNTADEFQPPGIAQNTAEIYDVASKTFRATETSMHVPRAYHTATRLSTGQILLVGGLALNDPFSRDDPGQASVELFDPVTETFTEIAPLTVGRCLHSATPLPSGDVLIAGGLDAFVFGNAANELGSAEIFDRATNTFRSAPNLVIPRGYHTATTLPSGGVLFTGGSEVSPTAEIFDPSTESFRLTAGLMHSIRIDARALMVPSGKVLIVGGDGANTLDAGPPFEDAELFDVSTEQFERISCPGCDGRVDHVMALLPSGSVGLFGGSRTTGVDPIPTADVATIGLVNSAFGALPQLQTVASTIVAPGSPQTVQGSALTSFWEGSSGPYVSPTNLPVALWVPFQGAPVIGSMVDWSDTQADWIPRSSAFAGPGLLFAARSGQLSSNALPVSVGLGPNGVTCDADTACESGFCSDGVCCNERCHDPKDPEAICRSCSVALGSFADGICSEATPGTDPHQDCAALPQCALDSATCGPKGECKPCTCNAESDCADGYTCTAAGNCEKPAGPQTSEGCSVSLGGAPAWPAALVALGLFVGIRRRRSACHRNRDDLPTSHDRQRLRMSNSLRAARCAEPRREHLSPNDSSSSEIGSTTALGSSAHPSRLTRRPFQ